MVVIAAAGVVPSFRVGAAELAAMQKQYLDRLFNYMLFSGIV